MSNEIRNEETAAIGIAMHTAGLIFPAGEFLELERRLVQGLRDIGYAIVPVEQKEIQE